ncbi:MAG: winged helix-turn-helix domain-containing protein [Solirubrobacteraceae bacterium]
MGGDSSGVAGEQVKLYVGYLRRKLELVLSEDEMPIETVRGFGYRYRPASASPTQESAES